jgi:hypothetical protein
VSVAIDKARNGVDTEKIFATLDLIKAQPELARFQFRATNRWIDGAHNRSTIRGFYAAGSEDTSRSAEFQIDAGEPAILLGSDIGANPAEYLLHALAACLTTSIVYVARRARWTSRPSSRPSRGTWTCAARSAWIPSRATIEELDQSAQNAAPDRRDQLALTPRARSGEPQAADGRGARFSFAGKAAISPLAARPSRALPDLRGGAQAL